MKNSNNNNNNDNNDDIYIYSQNIGIEFKIEKYAMRIIRGIKRQIPEGIELPNEKRIRTL